MSAPIQMLWIGPELSPMEQLSIASFLAHGHEVHIYVYDELRNVPSGAALLDGNDILPRARIFRYREHDSVSGFSNYFRYRLLLEKGGWWVDADTVCLSPFDFEEPYVFASERSRNATSVSAGAICAPRGSRVMQLAWEACDARDPTTVRWGETGPRLLSEMLHACGLGSFVVPPEVFCPIPFFEWRTIIDGTAPPLGEESRAVHLWNEMWRREGESKSAVRAPETLYAQLAARYAIGLEGTSASTAPAGPVSVQRNENHGKSS